jgi:plasmid stabilization system protein ParE
VGNFIVFYQPLEDGILVLVVLHGARDIPRLFRDSFGDRV